MKGLLSAFLFVGLTFAAAGSAEAQPSRSFRVGVAGGFSHDAHANFEGAATGVHGQLGLERELGVLDARLEAMFNRFGRARETEPCIPGAQCVSDEHRNQVASAVLSGVASFGRGLVRPYLIGGVGGYRFTHTRERELFCTGPCPLVLVPPEIHRATTEHFGVSAGFGVAFDSAPLGAFVESRYHHLFGGGDNRGFVPVSLGVRF